MEIRLIRKFILFFLLPITIILIAQATPKTRALTYQMSDKKKWIHDTQLITSLIGPEHFYFVNSDEVDLNIIPIQDNLLASIQERGTELFVKDILNGKNSTNKLFGAEETKLIDYQLDTISKQQVLQIHCKQVIGSKIFETLERYYITSGQALHIELRWPSEITSSLIQQAKTEFANFKISDNSRSQQ